MHVHARGTPALLSDNETWLTLYLANGITGVREMGGDYVETVFRWRAETVKGERPACWKVPIYRTTDASSKFSRGLRGWSFVGSP